jgi:hypothetical protein
MDTNEYLKKVLQSQDLADDSKEMKELQTHRKDVEELIRNGFSDCSPTIRYGGSKAKGTLIRDAYDLDLICYFPHDDTGAGKTLEEIYQEVRKILSDNYYVEDKTSSLRLKAKEETDHSRADFHIDVVPGRYTDDTKTDCFLHQASGEKERLKTNLDVHIEYVKDSGVLDSIRLLKLWNVRNNIRVRHFILELLIIKLLEGHKSLGLANQLEHVWEEIRDAQRPIAVQDPANTTGNGLSGPLSAVWAELSAATSATLNSIETSGWESVYGPIGEPDSQRRVEVLKRAAAAIATPTRPWCGGA